MTNVYLSDCMALQSNFTFADKYSSAIKITFKLWKQANYNDENVLFTD